MVSIWWESVWVGGETSRGAWRSFILLIITSNIYGEEIVSEWVERLSMSWWTRNKQSEVCTPQSFPHSSELGSFTPIIAFRRQVSALDCLLSSLQSINDLHTTNRVLLAFSTHSEIDTIIPFIWIPDNTFFSDHDRINHVVKQVTLFPKLIESCACPASDIKNYNRVIILRSRQSL